MASILQSNPWAAFRNNLGWKAHWADSKLILERPLALGKSFLYAPEIEIKEQKELNKLKERIDTLKTHFDPLFFRLEILDEYSEQNTVIVKLKTLGFVKAFEEIQPEWRQIIDLTKSEEELLAQMKPKGRYNISVAKRHRVIVKKENDLKTFYKLYQKTTKRTGIKGRALIYFQKLLKHFPENAQIYTAYYHDQPLASALIIFWADTATYLYGGSTQLHKEVMAPALLHWEIMREAKQRGCTRYDMGAVSPGLLVTSSLGSITTSKPATRNQKLVAKYAGITRFKQQFGGHTIHIIGSYDLIFKPFWYRLYRFIERWRRK